ncbi:hypothetical protein FACS1894176_10180 [Bacteroidia bacterium]|nr:hypothetical protein FACS1894176_10180 [Bacteroidia bacterium]
MYGQEETQPLITRSALEYNVAQSLWFNSSNAAGLTISPLHDYSIISAAYQHTSGEYKRQQEGSKIRDVVFNATGALQLGKLALWGYFTYSDNFTTGTVFNTNRYEPASDMPYYVADTTKNSDWKKQYYDMSVKVAFPLGERFALGADINYITKKAAKQLDPRSIIYAYSIHVAPSLLWKLRNQHSIGINGLYFKSFDKNNFTNSVTFTNHTVFVATGLGNYTKEVVGGQSTIGVFYYSGTQYGGGLQYAYKQDNKALLLDVGYSIYQIDVNDTPTKPYKRGTTKKNIIDGKLQAIHTGNLTHKLTAEYYLGNTDGIEYVQDHPNDYEIKQWITIAQFIRSTYKIQNIALNYDLFAGKETDYSWRAGLNAAYRSQKDEYVYPVSLFSADNANAEIVAKKNFNIGKTQTLLVGANVGYKLNLDGEYVFNPVDERQSIPNNPLAREFYPNELAYLMTDYARVGLSADWALITKNNSSVNIGLEWQYTKPTSGSDSRTYIGASAAYIF